MSYTTRQGQSIFDVMIQNKGSLTGLIDFIGDLETVNDAFFLGEILSIEKESNTITNFIDSKRVIISSVEEFILLAPTLNALSNPTTTTLDATWTLNSTEESGVQIELATDSLFASIVETQNLAAGTEATSFTGLTSGIVYYSRVRATGTINSEWSNTASETTPYDFQEAIIADGTNDTILVNNISADSFIDYQAISMWIKWPDTTPVTQQFVIQYENGNNFVNINEQAVGGDRNIRFNLEVNGSSNEILESISAASLGTTWHHFLFQFIPTGVTNQYDIKMYRDGSLVASSLADTFTGSMQSTFGQYRVFSSISGAAAAAVTIDQYVNMINVDAGADIVDIYNSGNGIDLYQKYDSSKYLVYWDMDEGVGGADNTGITAPELVDRSGNSHTGTMSNFTKTGSTSNWVDH